MSESEQARFETLYQLSQMIDQSEQVIKDFALEAGVQMTGSSVGYIFFMNEDETILTVHAWSKSVMETCEIPDPAICYPVDKMGLWGETVRQRQPIITNDYEQLDHWKHGYPVGHIPIKRHLNIPLIDNGKIVLVAGVGNKQTPYTDTDVQQLTLIMNGMWRLIQKKRTETALRESEARYRILVDNATDMISRHDPEGIYIYVSSLCRQLLGYEPEELIGHSAYDFFHPDDIEALRVAHMTVLDQPIVHLINCRVRRKDGSYLWMETTSKVLRDPETGVAKEIVAITRDISQRMQMQIEMEERLRFESFLADLSSQFINLPVKQIDIQIIHGLKSLVHFLDVDRATIFEFTRQQTEPYLSHSYAADGIVPFPSKISMDILDLYIEKLRNGEIIIMEQPESLSDPVWRERAVSLEEDIKSNLSVPLSVGGNVIGALGVTTYRTQYTWSDEIVQRVRLISEIFAHALTRKHAETQREYLLKQLQEQTEQIQRIMDTVPEGVILLETASDAAQDKWRIALVNPLGANDVAILAGVKVGETLTHLGGRPLSEFLTYPTKNLWHEIEVQNRVYQIIARPITTEGIFKSWVLVIRDLTWQRENQRRTQLQERLASVGQLAAGIAHDFNNIMSTIILYAQMTARSPSLSALDHERMTTISQQAHYATRLIAQILDFSRRAVLDRSALDLLPLLKEHIQILQRTLPENIDVKLVYGSENYTISGDPARLQQVFMNLAINARDAMPEGGLLCFELERFQITEMDAPPFPEMNPGDWIRISVSDNGTGIAPDALPHIFAPFFSTKLPGQGSGLGLAQVYGIIGVHEGYIDVNTRLGAGTTFILYLPALSLPVSPPLLLPTAELFLGHGEFVLVVEDNPTTQSALVEGLNSLNYQVLTAQNGQEALSLLESPPENAHIVLVLSDVVMPKMGGMALLRAMQERGYQTGVILLTGHPLKEELENLRSQSNTLLVDWLLKPISLEKLAAVVAQALK
ncbi:MAG: GAF domain-containing protein [Anaerolineae bacterium]|nr:GAF domain-containing protein [Anaerolineae bacterium]